MFCLPVRADDGSGSDSLRIAVVEADARGVRIEVEKTLDRTRRQGRLLLDSVALDEAQLLERPGLEVERELLPWAWTGLAAESVGGSDAVIELTAAYVKTRKQFDRVIGSFQAIKHPLVNALIQSEQSRSLTYAAAAAIVQGGNDAESLARMAVAAAGEAYAFAGSRAIQFHGGFGFTEDCDAHLYLRRAQSSRAMFGDPAHHRAWIARDLLD